MLIEFTYYLPSGDSRRTIEPYYLIFRWSSWYVWGWCLARQDFRLFKLNRMDGLHLTGQNFPGRPASVPNLKNERIFPGGIRVKALFQPECKWRLIEDFGKGCFEEQNDGTLLFHADYTDADNLISWILTFGDKVRLLEPEEIRLKLRDIIVEMQKNYQ